MIPLHRYILIFLMLFPWMLNAQVKTLDATINPDHFKIRHIGVDEGLTSGFMEVVFQDQHGYIWISTQYGTHVYDGYGLRDIRIRKSDSVFSRLTGVFNIFDDKDGRVWFCNIDGLFYYNRLRDEVIEQRLDPDFGDRVWFMGMYQDTRGGYWIFTRRSILRFDLERNEIVQPEIKNCINWWWGIGSEDFKLVETDDGSVWIPAGSDGLFQYIHKTGEFVNYRHDSNNPNSLSSGDVTDVLKDADGNLWISTSGGGLNIMNDLGRFEHILHKAGSENTIISDTLYTLMLDGSGNIWVAGMHGFSKYRRETKDFESFRIKTDQFPENMVVSIRQMHEDQDGHIWLLNLQYYGVLYYVPESEKVYHLVDNQDYKESLDGTNQVIKIFFDQSGTVWVVNSGAVNIIEKNPLKPFHLIRNEVSNFSSLSHSDMKAIFFDSSGTLWACTSGVLNRCEEFKDNLPVKFNRFPINDELGAELEWWSIIEDDNNDLLIGTPDGLFVFERFSGEYQRFTCNSLTDSLLEASQILRLFEDSRGRIWIGTDRGSGIFIFDPESRKVAHIMIDSDDPNGLYGGQQAFGEDSEGNIWIGHFGRGVSMLPKKENDKIFTSEKPRFERFNQASDRSAKPSSDLVLQIYKDSRDRMWFGTNGGLNLYDPQEDKFYSFDESDGLPNSAIRGILEDDLGNLWVSTLNGICKITFKDGYGSDLIQSIHNYGISDGLENTVFRPKSYCKSPDGWMYFGGLNGITVFHPDSIKDNPIIPPVHISNILINETGILDLEEPILTNSILETDHIKLPSKQNFLAFEFVALNYLVPEKNQYKYMMEGLDDDWVKAGTRRFAEYRDMQPGQYTFRVIASNEDGLWNEIGDSIGITITPPWYRSILAYFIYGILVLAAIYGFIRWRTWSILRERDELEVQVKERTSVIENQKEEIQAANTILEGQKEELEQQKEELKITLENLQKTQTQLIQSEKLASLGGLVAGVAHEINTPVGISVTAASSLAEETQQMADKYKANKISRAEFKDYLNTANQSAKLILSNMEKTAMMVQSFKQVSVDQSTEQKRKFKLREYSEDVIRSLYPKLKEKEINIELDINENLELDSYPGAYSQVITNLVLNSIVHGFEGRDSGSISLSAQAEKSQIQIKISDDGKGIPEEIIPRIFDPFFTTNKKAGTGLGLHIVHNLVNQRLNGTISCESKNNEGTSMIITMPL